MPPDPTTAPPTATYEAIPKESWEPFFDAFSRVLEGARLEIEVIGLDLGDQIEAEYLPLDGLTYDRRSDTFFVLVEGPHRELDHAVPHPREILIRSGARGIEHVVVIAEDDHQHIIRLREPLMLPERAPR